MNATSILLLALVGIIVGAALHFLRMAKQTARIEEAAQAIVQGDTSARVQLDAGPLARVGRAFNVVAAQLEKDIVGYKSSQVELEHLVTTDRLTGVGNRRAFDQLTELEASLAKRYGVPVSIIMLDVDHFKRINDTYGHAVGDTVLIGITRRISARLRDTDSIARWGGEEFAVITPCTPISGAEVLADAMRRVVADEPFGIVGRVTISLGVAQLSLQETAAQWVSRADRVMYEAKRSGRNCVRLLVDPSSSSSPFILAWGDQFLTNIPQVDEEHAEMFHLANNLLLLESDSSRESILACMDALLVHLVRHSDAEEQLLGMMGCADVELHAAEHRGLIAQANELRNQLADGSADTRTVSDFVVRRVAIGHLVSGDLPLFTSLSKPSGVVTIASTERPSLRIRLQRAIGR
jgi:diguanylate cyclase (GGDEF)-like protein/hemerythrin-like metal-binding protein